MATYAIGDIQGCHATLRRLLDRIGFGDSDRVWLVGDLVNRGPDSLSVLRWAHGLGDRCVSVLGNHDLHLLALGMEIGSPRFGDTLEPILAADDAPALLTWLRGRPLFHREGDHALVHAGLLPQWTMEEAEVLAAEACAMLQGRGAADLIGARFLGEVPRIWSSGLTGLERHSLVLGTMTRIRTCTPGGRMCSRFAGPPEDAPKDCVPWYTVPGRRSRGRTTLLFGHWAALGFHREANVIGLDSGCVWGNSLTAYRLEDGAVFQEPTAPGDEAGRSGTHGPDPPGRSRT